LSWKIFEGWLDGNAPNTTPGRTAVFTYCLLRRLAKENLPAELNDIYWPAKEQIKDAMKRITYMNLDNYVGRPDMDSEQIRLTWKLYEAEVNRKSKRDLIVALEPDIFVVSTEEGCKLLNHIYEGKLNLPWKGIARLDKTLFVSVPQPARSGFSNNFIVETIDKICAEIGGVSGGEGNS
jgi:hypothetical protein